MIEKPPDNDPDLSGWDFRKTMLLFKKSNPPLLEWLQSPIVYREHFSITERLRALIPDYYSPRSCLYHYLFEATVGERELRMAIEDLLDWKKKEQELDYGISFFPR